MPLPQRMPLSMSLTYFAIYLAAAAAFATPSLRAESFDTGAEALVLTLAKETIAMRSVRGPGNQSADVANRFRQALVEGGWPAQEIEVIPFEETAYFIATWPGLDRNAGAIIISAHLDVVDADPADWTRDPFTPVVEDGYLFGRGASDTKFDASLALVATLRLRQTGYQPSRDIVIAYSGDEETTMATSKVIAERFRNAHLVLNVDGASGTLDETTGEPLYWSWQGAEKSYIDYRLEVTNPGGHSSAPREDNAIAQLSGALSRIAAHRFEPELNDITLAYFEQAANLEKDPHKAAAMRAFAANPMDPEALRVLRSDPYLIGRTATTCVPTMIEGGHAPNALPQRASAVVNCRVFPGRSFEEVQAELAVVANEPALTITDMSGDETTQAPASPYNPAFVGAFKRALYGAWGEMPIIPMQASGASDSMWYRALGVPSYGASSTFMKESDDFSHGLNERVPINNIRPGLAYYQALLQDLTSP